MIIPVVFIWCRGDDLNKGYQQNKGYHIFNTMKNKHDKTFTRMQLLSLSMGNTNKRAARTAQVPNVEHTSPRGNIHRIGNLQKQSNNKEAKKGTA